MEEFFRLLWRNVNAYRKDSKCFKIVQTNRLSVKENTDASECNAQNKLNSIFAFAFHNMSSPSSFWDLWTDELFKPCERLQLSETLLPTETTRLFTSDDPGS